MQIRDLESLTNVLDTMARLRLFVDRLNRVLKRNDENQPLTGRLAGLDAAVDRLESAAVEVETLIDQILDDPSWPVETKVLEPAEVLRLEHLNHVMNDISRFMHQTADAIRPIMQGKVADAADPMFDYEIEAKIDYRLREDDPEYSEDSDNGLSSRSEYLSTVQTEPELREDWRHSMTPEPLQREPLSWLLHTLTEHNYGPEGPRVSLKDCLRIGTVFLDIQVWWQYAFDVDQGKWIKCWRQPEGVPEYLETERPAKSAR